MKNGLPSLVLVLIFIIACGRQNKHPIVTTFAGSGAMGSTDGKGITASFSNLMGLTLDVNGNVYIADSRNNLIRKIAPDGTVTTFAGSGAVGLADGKAEQASFFNPAGVAVDKLGNVYVADTHNSLIRKISSDGMVTTIAGKRAAASITGADSSIRLDNPAAIAVDSNNNIYIADWANDVIRKISPSGKAVILAGSVGAPGSKDGIGSSASFYLPAGIAVDSAGNVYVSDTYNNIIRKISTDGMVTTLAGKKTKGSTNGTGAAASFSHPQGIAVDKKGYVYVADAGNNKIRKISPGGVVTTFAGSGSRGSANGQDTIASFYRPFGIAVDKDGTVFVADYQNNMVRKISY